MRVRALMTLRRKNPEINKDIVLNWAFISRYRTKAGAIHKQRQSLSEAVNRGKVNVIREYKHSQMSNETKCCMLHLRTGGSDLLKEFPHPKNLLHATVSKSLGLSDLSEYIQYSCTDGEVKVICPYKMYHG